jgi:hypothetical protein
MMIHAGRVGSTVVASRLTSLPLIVAGEIFNPIVNGIPDWPIRYEYIEFYRRMRQEARERGSPYFKYEQSQLLSSSAYLFEYKPYHAGCSDLIETAVNKFFDNGVTDVIFLHRKNYLRRYVSFLISRNSGIWHTSCNSSKPYQINIDPMCCEDSEIGIACGTLIELINHYYNNYVPSIKNAISSRRHLVLAYEDHVESDPNVAFSMIRELLGFDDGYDSRDIGYRKQNAFSLQDIIGNYDQVAEIIESHGYSFLLD